MRVSTRGTLLAVGLIVLVGVTLDRGRPESADALSAADVAARRCCGTGRAGRLRRRRTAVEPRPGRAVGCDRHRPRHRDAALLDRQRPQPRHAGDDCGRRDPQRRRQRTLTVGVPGGVDANRKFPIAMTYPGAPRIAPDEEVFLFLVRADDEVAQSYAMTGFSQGKFSIESAAGRRFAFVCRAAEQERSRGRRARAALGLQGRNPQLSAVGEEAQMTIHTRSSRRISVCVPRADSRRRHRHTRRRRARDVRHHRPNGRRRSPARSSRGSSGSSGTRERSRSSTASTPRSTRSRTRSGPRSSRSPRRGRSCRRRSTPGTTSRRRSSTCASRARRPTPAARLRHGQRADVPHRGELRAPSPRRPRSTLIEDATFVDGDHIDNDGDSDVSSAISGRRPTSTATATSSSRRASTRPGRSSTTTSSSTPRRPTASASRSATRRRHRDALGGSAGTSPSTSSAIRTACRTR